MKKKIIIKIRSLEEAFHDMGREISKIKKGDLKKRDAVLGFEDYEDYKKVLTPRRLDLLRFIKTENPGSIRQIASGLDRDLKNVHGDLKILENVGLVKVEKKERNFVPRVVYDELDIRINVPLKVKV
tara:strand:- start:364 stop:744 length:381 start_codon:yes stop_codon:yes gene_type:complete